MEGGQGEGLQYAARTLIDQNRQAMNVPRHTEQSPVNKLASDKRIFKDVITKLFKFNESRCVGAPVQ